MKRVLRIFAIGIVLGVAMVLIQRSLRIDRQVFLRWYWLAAAVVLIGIFTFNLLYARRYLNKMRQAMPLLEENRTGEYISTVEELLRQVRGRYLKNLFRLNLAAGYLEARQFDQAIDMMEALSREPLRGTVKIVHRLNLCFGYFRVGRYEEAMKLYYASQKEFEQARKVRAYQSTLDIIEIFADIAEGRYDDARARLDSVRSQTDAGNTPRTQTVYYYLQTLLEQQHDE